MQNIFTIYNNAEYEKEKFTTMQNMSNVIVINCVRNYRGKYDFMV